MRVDVDPGNGAIELMYAHPEIKDRNVFMTLPEGPTQLADAMIAIRYFLILELKTAAAGRWTSKLEKEAEKELRELERRNPFYGQR